MEEIDSDSIISLFFAIGYLWGVIVIIRFCMARVNRGTFLKSVSAIVLFLTLNAPLKAYYYVMTDVYHFENSIKQLINIFLNTYIVVMMLVGTFGILRVGYVLYVKYGKISE